MRAGLLSDPRVVALLQTHFIPVHVSERNTPDCMRDRRDLELLARYAGGATDDFDGGEREVFVLPDGRMQRVFLSLHGTHAGNGCTQMTAAGRRSDDAVALFRTHGAAALQQLHGELPADWQAIWDGKAPQLAALQAAGPQWPLPAAGEAALRVFVRNSYRQYDDLHGCELVPLADAEVAALAAGLRSAGDRAALPRAAFVALANAMVPRGQVATRLQPESIGGGLEFVVEAVDGDGVRGRIDGRFALQPKAWQEVGLRQNAVCMFSSAGRFAGRFALAAGRLQQLRAVATEVEFAWRPRFGSYDGFAPRHQVAIEWVSGPPDGR